MFLNCHIKNIKTANSVHTNTANNIIVVSSCYFTPSNFSVDNKTFNYVNELIANIESFHLKINKYTTNPSRWIYRVYIESSVLELKDIMDSLIEKHKQKTIVHNLKIDNITNIVTNIINNYNFYLFIYLLLTKYIEQILNPINIKYNQIELFTYTNNDVRNKLNSNS